MQHLLTNRTASLTELRDPAKILAQAGSAPVAILNRNKVEGYFVPASAVDKITFVAATPEEVAQTLKSRMPALAATLEYLKDK